MNLVVFPIGITWPMSLAIVMSQAVSPKKLKMAAFGKTKILISKL